MNKYHSVLDKILNKSKIQKNKKGNILYLLNEQLTLQADDLHFNSRRFN